MPSSQSVSIRIPQELLEQLDAIAIQNYPARNSGTPNRSRMILDFIHRGIEAYDEHNDKGIQRQTSGSYGGQTLSDRGIEEIVEQQVQIHLEVHRQVQQLLEQQRPYGGAASEMTEMRQEVAEMKRTLDAMRRQSSSPEGQNSTSVELQPQSTSSQRTEPTILLDPQPDSVLQINDSSYQMEAKPQSAFPSSEQEIISQTTLQQSDNVAPQFPEWMTALQAFQFLGGDSGDRTSSVSSADGSKQIKFSTFKSKTPSELKPFGLELNLDRKRRRQPCYRLLGTASFPSDEEILQLIGELDQQMRTDNYLPIFHLREKLQPPLSRDELDRALYRLERKDLIELSTLQEVIAYTSEQIEAGIPQNVGGPLFFIIRCDRP